MPNKKSAMKRLRSNAKKHERNLAALSELHSRHKKLFATAGEKGATVDGNALKVQAQEFISKLDKAACRGIIPTQRANRKKARVANLLLKLEIGK